MQRAAAGAARQFGIECLRLGAHHIAVGRRDDGVDARVVTVDLAEERFQHLHAGDLAGMDGARQGDGIEFGDRVGGRRGRKRGGKRIRHGFSRCLLWCREKAYGPVGILRNR
ncbi:hypothetical protein D9M72_502400 [compost metagenome]